jgi:adenosine deaminase
MGRVWVPYTLPKAEMHVHIALALSVETFLRRIKDTRTTLTADFLVQRDQRYYPALQDFHYTYEAMRHITATPQELAEATQVYLERIAREGCIYAELSSSFRYGMDFKGQIDALSAGILAAKHNTGIEARIVVTSLRDSGAEVAEAAVAALKKIKNPLIASFGLVGNEAITPLAEFKRALHDAWHELGIGLTPHVAEQRIENALDFFSAVPEDAFKNPQKDHRKLRIGHGTLVHRSSELIKRFVDAGICFEICLSANKRIGVPEDIKHMHPDNRASSADNVYAVDLDLPLRHYFQDLHNHPMRMMIDAGIPVCLGSDNPLLMNTNIGKEYALARKYLNCSEFECVQITKNALKFANIDAETQTRLLEIINKYELQLANGSVITDTVLGYREAKEIL